MSSAPRALLLENVHPSARDLLEAANYKVELVKGALKESELIEAVRGVTLLGIRSKTQITRPVIEAADELLALGCFCIGTNQVDLSAANLRGVPVFNAPFSNTRSVAELMIGEMIMLTRHLGDHSREVHQGIWRKVATGSHEIRGKTLGIIGYGHIGSQLGVLAESLGLRVLFYDVQVKLPLGNNRPITSLEDLLRESDFVSLHVPATPLTENLVDAKMLANMKRGAMLLNASRGSVVDIPALAAAIKEGHIAGAAVDVYPWEPETNSEGFQSDLQNLPNVVLTPHIGGSTEEAQEAIGREVATSLSRFALTGSTASAVNFPQAELPPVRGTHRVLNVHRNVPGVLRDVNKIVSDHNANIHSQVLNTDPNIGYLIMDLDQDVSASICEAISKLPTNIRTRVLF